MPATSPKMPRRIAVGPHVFRVFCDAKSWARMAAYRTIPTWGLTVRETCEIFICPDLSESTRRETLFHELFHACEVPAGFLADGRSDRHEYLTGVSPYLFDALRRNPQLHAYLMSNAD